MQASKITVGGVKAFDYTALLMGTVLGDESGLRQLGNMADPWNVEVPGLLDGPGRCVPRNVFLCLSTCSWRCRVLA